MELHQMTGLGRVAEEKLRRAGIETPEQLREVGAKEALLRVRLHAGPGVLPAPALRPGRGHPRPAEEGAAPRREGRSKGLLQRVGERVNGRGRAAERGEGK